MKILWSKKGSSLCEGHEQDQLCPKCGHYTLTWEWQDNNHWNGYAYDGDYIQKCRYCILLNEEGGFSTEPKNECQREMEKLLRLKHKNKHDELIRKSEMLERELKGIKEELNKQKP